MSIAVNNTCDPSSWVERFGDELFRYACARISKQDEAEDLVQETFLAALKSLKTFRGEASEKTWLYNILKNKIIDHYRKKATKNKYGFSDSGESAEFFAQFFTERGAWDMEKMPGSWNKNADDDLTTEEFMNVLQYCMEKLPELGAAVFALKNFEDKNTDEICKELNITTSNLWVIVHRTKLQLRGCLEANWIKG